MLKEIPLTQGYIALVSDEDYERVSQYKWHALVLHNGVRPARKDENQKTILMYRFITDAPPERVVDHRDGNTLNNTRDNLRVCSLCDNQANRKKQFSHDGYKGVHRFRNKWMAAIRVRGKRIYLGCFNDPVEGAKKYDKAARTHFGEFARVNFPERGEARA